MRVLLLALIPTLISCGDVSRLQVNLRFPSPEIASATRQLVFVVRQPPKDGDGCKALWERPQENLAEFDRLVDYPNRTDVVAAPLDVGNYNVFVYAFAAPLTAFKDAKGEPAVFCSTDDQCKSAGSTKKCRAVGILDAVGNQRLACTESESGLVPLVGGCAGGVVDVAGATEQRIDLAAKPAG